MNLLLDTHLLLWAAGQPERLSQEAADLLLDPSNQLWFSAASLWEIAIKQGLGRPDFRVDARRLWRLLPLHGYSELPVSGEHAIAVAGLEPRHKDPFDRILIAQARVEQIMLITADAVVAAYGDCVQKV
jgi:PIN domain nuclease of toxin-antitoxin system